MLSKKGGTFLGVFLLVPLLWCGCHSAAAPVALKVAKYRKAALLHRAYRTRAVTAMEKQYDVNGNGVIDPQESKLLRQRLIHDKSMQNWKKMDIDGDGVVDSAEFQFYRDEISNR